MGTNSRALLDGIPLKSVSASMPVRNFVSDSAEPEANPQQKASVVLDMTFIRCDIKNEWAVAELTAQGFRVSKSLVSRWRSPEYAELPTYAHIVALGPDFERAYSKSVSQVNGYGRIAFMDVAKALGDLAVEMSA